MVHPEVTILDGRAEYTHWTTASDLELARESHLWIPPTCIDPMDVNLRVR